MIKTTLFLSLFVSVKVTWGKRIYLDEETLTKIDGYSSFFLFNSHIEESKLLQACPNFYPSRVTPLQNTTVRVGALMEPKHFIAMEDVNKGLTITARLTLTWNAPCENSLALEQLVNAKEKKTFFITTNPEIFWKPDVWFANGRTILMNSGEKRHFLKISHSRNFVVFSWQSVGIFEFTCDIDPLKFPVDVQKCGLELQLISRSYFSLFNYCENKLRTNEIAYFMGNGSNWQLIETSCEIANPGLDEHQISLFFTLKRRPNYYVMHLLIPNSLLIALEFCTFLLPPDSADRTAFSVSIYLALILLETILVNLVPHTPQQILLADFLLFQSVFSTSITIYSAVLTTVAGSLQYPVTLMGGFEINRRIFYDVLAFSIAICALTIEAAFIIIKLIS